MMMSFIGSVGSVMSGSGLSDALEMVYGPNAVVQMMNGKAVSWALRGFFMVDAAVNVQLMRLLLPEDETGENSIGAECLTCAKLESAHLESIRACYDSVLENRYVASEESSLTAVMKLELLLQCMKSKLSQESRTAKLWIQYMHHVETLQMFIRAEGLEIGICTSSQCHEC